MMKKNVTLIERTNVNSHNYIKQGYQTIIYKSFLKIIDIFKKKNFFNYCYQKTKEKYEFIFNFLSYTQLHNS
jgi:hypothetical protein